MPHVAFLLGIRPDLIRASRIMRLLREDDRVDLTLIWSGQHYSDNLKDVFIRELGLPRPDFELGANGNTDASLVASVIDRLYPVLDEQRPDAVMFLGDTNTVMGCLAAAQLNMPIVHIEGCMRSYDWRMPEEKYRTTIDHLSDVVYAYFDAYKAQGVAEGLNPRNIVVTGNLIVDVLQDHYFAKRDEFAALLADGFLEQRGLAEQAFYLMTCHRRENVEDRRPLSAILDLVAASPYPVYFPASYRTQNRIREFALALPDQLTLVDPVGYRELLALLVSSRGVLTDSGTVVEESAVLGVPSVQMRKSTERPQVYDCGASVKFDPDQPDDYPAEVVLAKLDARFGEAWDHRLGDGHASERIAGDLVSRLLDGRIDGHRPEDFHLDVTRSYREDGLPWPIPKV